ncbi:MAG: LemA family protein [Deltaproteobacteria bacterium]|nr:LemA family protein [Deltaproteobacteria bacterium]
MKTSSFFKAIFSLFTLTVIAGCGVQSIPMQNNEVEASWAEVLNQYQRRADLIPNLVEVVKGYAKHERETLEAVISARAAATSIKIDAKDLTEENLQKFQAAQSQLRGTLSRLMLVAERYPDLKANQNFRDLQVQLEGTENRITIARQRYIEQVKVFNNLIGVFPTSITNAIFFHHSKKPQFTVENETEIKKPPTVKF